MQKARASAARAVVAALRVLVRAPSWIACSAEARRDWRLRRKASWSRRRRRTLGYRPERRPASVVTRECSKAQTAHGTFVSCCSSTMLVCGSKSLSFSQRFLADVGGAIVMFVFGLGSLSGSLLGRQNKPRCTWATPTRVNIALSRVHFHQSSIHACQQHPCISAASNYTTNKSRRRRLLSCSKTPYNPLRPIAPSPMNTTAPAPNNAPVGFPA